MSGEWEVGINTKTEMYIIDFFDKILKYQGKMRNEKEILNGKNIN